MEVERLHRPELRGKPVVIGGRPGSRGVVAACSYEARALGVHSAMPMGQAYRRVKAQGGMPQRDIQVHFLHEGLYGNYSRYSRKVQEILRGAVPVFNSKSIDEFEMDLSGCERLFKRDYGGMAPFAEYLRRRVREEVGLPLSIGIGPSRIAAKMASRHAKPDGVFVVPPDQLRGFLAPHGIEDVPGIGPVTAAALHRLGVRRVGELLRLPPRLLRHTFGIGMARLLHALEGRGDEAADGSYFGYDGEAGDEERPGPSSRQPKSIGHETTFERDVADRAVLMRTLWRLSENACRRLRAKNLRARHVTVKIRYSDFATLTHGGFLPAAASVESVIFKRACELFAEGNTRRLRIRLLGVRLSRFSAGTPQQQIFAGACERSEDDFFTTVDCIRERYGQESVLVGPGVMRLAEQRPPEANSTAGIPSAFLPQ